MEYPTPPDRQVAPPGWYRDASAQMKWWDGTHWVDPSSEQRPDATWSIFSHLSWFVLPIVCPLLVRLIRSEREPYSKHHSTEALNAQITFLVVLLALIGSLVITSATNPGTGSPGWLVLVVVRMSTLAALTWTVLSIYGAVQASRGKWWRYPASIRLVPGATGALKVGGSAASTPTGPLLQDRPPLSSIDAPAPSPSPPAPTAPHPPPPAALYPPPPPHPYAPEAGYRPPPSPPPRQSNSTRVVVIVVGVLVVLAIVGAVVASLTVFKGAVNATDVKVGDCLKVIPDGTLVGTVQTVACEESHAGEVVAVLTMPSGSFPGQPAIDAFLDKCGPALADYSPATITDESVQLSVLFPTAESWKQGDWTVTCIATLNPPRVGSIKG